MIYKKDFPCITEKSDNIPTNHNHKLNLQAYKLDSPNQKDLML